MQNKLAHQASQGSMRLKEDIKKVSEDKRAAMAERRQEKLDRNVKFAVLQTLVMLEIFLTSEYHSPYIIQILSGLSITLLWTYVLFVPVIDRTGDLALVGLPLVDMTFTTLLSVLTVVKRFALNISIDTSLVFLSFALLLDDIIAALESVKDVARVAARDERERETVEMPHGKIPLSEDESRVSMCSRIVTRCCRAVRGKNPNEDENETDAEAGGEVTVFQAGDAVLPLRKRKEDESDARPKAPSICARLDKSFECLYRLFLSILGSSMIILGNALYYIHFPVTKPIVHVLRLIHFDDAWVTRVLYTTDRLLLPHVRSATKMVELNLSIWCAVILIDLEFITMALLVFLDPPPVGANVTG